MDKKQAYRNLMGVDLFILAGEMSGDQLGASLMQELFYQFPKLKVVGIGGPKMVRTGLDLFFPMEELQVMGFIDVLRALPRILPLFKKTVREILKIQPKVIVTIDYPGFNLRLIKRLRKEGFKGKICHYVSPSVWAWGKKRVQELADCADLLLTILPFERSYFASTKLRVEYVGHPLAEMMDFSAKPRNPHLIVLFPGSRAQEIKRHLPLFLRLIDQLRKELPCLEYVVSLSQERYRFLLQGLPKGVSLATKEELQCLSPSFAIAKSGTIALELALQRIPSVIVYALSRIDYLLAKYVLKISLPFYSLPNLILGERVFPELIGFPLDFHQLVEEVKKIITDKTLQDRCQKQCIKVANLLRVEDGVYKAAQAILNLMVR